MDETIKQQLTQTLEKTEFSNLGKFIEGKVRDNYVKEDKRFIITTDRISAFDRNLGTIPFKGEVLTQIANFWFDKTKDIVQNHIIGTPDPNVIVVKECKALPVEFIVRAYLTGTSTTSAWYNYNRGVRNLCGNTLPDGMKKNQKFEKPILTPTTKSKAGDQNISKETILAEGLIDEDLLDQIEEVCFKLFQRGTEVAAQRGLILVDTKYEFGLLDGKLVLIDEVHTPDSSRYWYINTYQELFEKEADQRMLDKEYVREWLVSKGFRGEGVPPPITDEVRTEASKRYLKVYEILTGQLLTPTTSNVVERIKDNLTKGGYI